MSETSIERKKLLRMCREAGMHCATYSPGDGVTRYRFGPADPGSLADGSPDYFAMSAWYTCLGWKEASAYIRGFLAARGLSHAF